MKTTSKILTKIVDYVATREGCCSVGMVWVGVFPKAALKTVRARVQTLVEAGRLEFEEPWADGYAPALRLTDAERRDRAMDARVKTRR